ncbi:hypothetical protein GCM10022224_058100 [Nonomuraea antimicrobica]|uniref:MFS transporter n=1 Tax=Nonomuraea antimicrobica TaxID=561173 RepID=A0ABP7CDV0_9ACTN
MEVGRPVIRALRAAAFAAICILASAALHLLVGGGAIRPQALGLAVVATWATAYALGARQRGGPTLLALCGLSQYGLHRLFATPDDVASTLVPSITFDPAGHEHGAGSGMVLIHVAVAVGSSWWLARGEAALAALLRLAAVRVAGWCGLVVAALAVPVRTAVATGPAVVPVWPETARRVPASLVRVVSRRGPPQGPPRVAALPLI